MDSIFVGLGLLSSLFGFGDQQDSDYRAYDGPPAEYACSPFQWTEAPHMVSGQLHAMIVADCTFIGQSGGGVKELAAYITDKTLHQSVTVHSGPTDETYDGMPSTFYDVTIKMDEGGDSVTARNDMHIATNDDDKLTFDSFSKKVSGTGNADYLKKIDILAKVQAIKDNSRPNQNAIRMGSRFVLDKPWYAPGGMFVSEVKKRIEAKLPETEAKLISELAQHI